MVFVAQTDNAAAIQVSHLVAAVWPAQFVLPDSFKPRVVTAKVCVPSLKKSIVN
jgi:hypothetical protein